MKFSLDISSFLEPSLIFPFLLISSISLHCSLKKPFLSLLAVLQNSAFSWVSFPFSPAFCFSSFLNCKFSSDNHFIFLDFFFLGISFRLLFLGEGFCFSSFLNCKISSDNHFIFLDFFFLGRFWSPPPLQYYEPLSIVLQALCLPDLSPWIYSSPQLYNLKGFGLGHTWMVWWFSLLSSI